MSHLEHNRRSGRTVKMLASALAAAVNGDKVLLVAHSMTYANILKRRLEDAAQALDVELKHLDVKVFSSEHTEYEREMRLTKRKVFCDHFVWESRRLRRVATHL